MMSFWIIAVLLIVVALYFVLPTLLQGEEKSDDVERSASNVAVYQDQLREMEDDLRNGVLSQEQYEQARTELQRRLLEDVNSSQKVAPKTKSSAHANSSAAYVLGFALPLTAILLYTQLGNQKAITSHEVAPAQAAKGIAAPQANSGGAAPGGVTDDVIKQRVGALAERLEKNPNDAQGWLMLARSYTMMDRYSEAAKAYAHAASLINNDAQLYADYADALAMSQGKLAGEPVNLINKALAIDPNNQKALALAGSAAFDVNDFKGAINYWEKLLKLLPPGSETAGRVSESIEEARQRAGAK